MQGYYVPDWVTEVDAKWTLFLDRDGVINLRLIDDYVKDVAEFSFLPGVLDAISLLTAWFNRIIVVTNQQGVGKGLMTHQQLNKIHHYMCIEISEAGGHIDQIFSCTHLATEFNNCRKPNPSMALQAVGMFPEIKLSKSIMVGDMPSDILFGQKTEMKTVYCGDPYLLKDVSPNLIVKDLQTFTSLLRETLFT